MKYENVFLNNKWQTKDNLTFKKEIVGNLTTFQKKTNDIKL